MTYPIMSTKVPWSLVQGGFRKTPHFNTATQKAATGRRSTVSFMPFPTWDFEVDLNHVCGGEAQQFSVLQDFLGCYLACQGSGQFFLFTDPNDNTVVNQSVLLNVTPGGNPLGVAGDGTSTQFQLARSIGPSIDILQNPITPAVYVNGTKVTPAVSPTGLVTFAEPPALAAALTWQGRFQYLCQFKEDTLNDLARVSKNTKGWLWSCNNIAFEGVFV